MAVLVVLLVRCFGWGSEVPAFGIEKPGGVQDCNFLAYAHVGVLDTCKDTCTYLQKQK